LLKKQKKLGVEVIVIGMVKYLGNLLMVANKLKLQFSILDKVSEVILNDLISRFY
jgi:hypothetical protein